MIFNTSWSTIFLPNQGTLVWFSDDKQSFVPVVVLKTGIIGGIDLFLAAQQQNRKDSNMLILTYL